MASTVFILGAGASKQAGAPLMANFLDVADELLQHPDKAVDKDAFDRVTRGRNQLESVVSKAFIDIQNVEGVFSAFEFARLLREVDIAEISRRLQRIADEGFR